MTYPVHIGMEDFLFDDPVIDKWYCDEIPACFTHSERFWTSVIDMGKVG